MRRPGERSSLEICTRASLVSVDTESHGLPEMAKGVGGLKESCGKATLRGWMVMVRNSQQEREHKLPMGWAETQGPVSKTPLYLRGRGLLW